MIDLESGVPGITAGEPASFDEFWPFYLSQHLHPTTRAVHAVGTVAAVLTGLSGIARRKPLTVLGAPLLAYGPAFASHFIFEKNTPVTLKGSVLWAMRADFTMLAKTLTGRVDADVEAIRSALNMKPGQVTIADWNDDRESGIEITGAATAPISQTATSE